MFLDGRIDAGNVVLLKNTLVKEGGNQNDMQSFKTG
jgi:hypothetical protein